MAKFRIMKLGLRRLARVAAKFIRATIPSAKITLAENGEEKEREERMPSVFVPEVLLPEQYNDLLRRKRLLKGEKLLMFAILEDAVESYMTYLNASTSKGQDRFREAEEWINHRNPLELFSFDSICEALDINADYLRNGLLRWKEAHLQPPPPADAS